METSIFTIKTKKITVTLESVDKLRIQTKKTSNTFDLNQSEPYLQVSLWIHGFTSKETIADYKSIAPAIKEAHKKAKAEKQNT